jgi:hypothetical protein
MRNLIKSVIAYKVVRRMMGRPQRRTMWGRSTY